MVTRDNLLNVTRCPNKSMQMPTTGTMKKPAYWSRAEYQPAVTALTLKRCSAISVAFCLKTTAVLVVNSE